MKRSNGEAAAFRAYHIEVPEEIRKDIYADIMSCEVNGSSDAFEDLTKKILAYTASGYLLPSQASACHDLLALISHSIVSRKTSTARVTISAEVSKNIAAAERLTKQAAKALPDYGNLKEFTAAHEVRVLDAVEVVEQTTPKLRIKPQEKA